MALAENRPAKSNTLRRLFRFSMLAARRRAPRVGIDFDDTPHFASVLSRNAGGIDGQRPGVIGLNLGTGSRRAIVGQGHSIDHELGLIFGASGCSTALPS